MVQVEEEKKDEEKVIVKESVDKEVQEVVNAKNPALSHLEIKNVISMNLIKMNISGDYFYVQLMPKRSKPSIPRK